MKKVYSLAFLLYAAISCLPAQSTFDQVHAIFQAKCTGACHSGGSPSGNLDLSGTTAAVYNRLVNVAPTNPAAVAAKYKRVVPGYPYRSYLLKKVNHGLDPANDLASVNLGASMPSNSDTLAKGEIELIRQWIIWGAKDTGTAYNSNLIHDYYNGLGVVENTAPLTPAQEGRAGYQVKFGPIFLQPGGEFEYFQVYNPDLPAGEEITEMHSKLPPNAHHWVLRSLSQAGVNAMPVQPLNGNDFNTQILVYQYTKFMGIWQFSDDLVLPQGTAHYRDSTEAFLVNLHMKNYSGTQILAASSYVNFYTQPWGTGNIQMKTDLSSYGGTNPFLLQIPPTGQPDTLQNVCTSPGETRYFWNIQSHTHQWGKSFNMYHRNPDGSKGAQFYDGNYNENYTFNQGYYDYSHPAVRTFDPLMEVDMTNGLIFEASWVNNTGATIPFSLTTAGEMFVTYFQYTNELPTTGIKPIDADTKDLKVYPNPTNTLANINVTETWVGGTLTVNDVNGSKVMAVQINNQKTALNTQNLPNGIYILTLSKNGDTQTKKLVINH